MLDKIRVKQSKKFNMLSIAFLLFLVIIFFIKALPFNHRLISGGDSIHCLHLAKFILDELSINHSIPLWNPYIYSGISNAPWIFYFFAHPLNYLFLILPAYAAINYIFILH